MLHLEDLPAEYVEVAEEAIRMLASINYFRFLRTQLQRDLIITMPADREQAYLSIASTQAILQFLSTLDIESKNVAEIQDSTIQTEY